MILREVLVLELGEDAADKGVEAGVLRARRFEVLDVGYDGDQLFDLRAVVEGAALLVHLDGQLRG